MAKGSVFLYLIDQISHLVSFSRVLKGKDASRLVWGGGGGYLPYMVIPIDHSNFIFYESANLRENNKTYFFAFRPSAPITHCLYFDNHHQSCRKVVRQSHSVEGHYESEPHHALHKSSPSGNKYQSPTFHEIKINLIYNDTRMITIRAIMCILLICIKLFEQTFRSPGPSFH